MLVKRQWRSGAYVAAGLVAAGALGMTVSLGGLSARAQQADVMELARRAIGGPGGAQNVALLPGQVPPGMPLGLPLPAGANVVGTVVHNVGNGVTGWEVVLDVSGSPIDAGMFYEQRLPAMGWAPPQVGEGAPPPGLFCQSSTGPWLAVIAVPISEQASDVRIRVGSGDAGPCAGPPPAP